MSRTSTSTAASFSRPDPSPTAAAPSLPREASCNSQESLPSFSTGAIDDFVLFPNDFAGYVLPSYHPNVLQYVAHVGSGLFEILILKTAGIRPISLFQIMTCKKPI
jgi:hypothetical protein